MKTKFNLNDQVKIVNFNDQYNGMVGEVIEVHTQDSLILQIQRITYALRLHKTKGIIHISEECVASVTKDKIKSIFDGLSTIYGISCKLIESNSLILVWHDLYTDKIEAQTMCDDLNKNKVEGTMYNVDIFFLVYKNDNSN